ncbi:MAG TPA: MarR family transcriptional regulator [Nocardioidaceae bacterium]|nr:MarR family transcriptional regulator [Nocardioidaceae bacterium]
MHGAPSREAEFAATLGLLLLVVEQVEGDTATELAARGLTKARTHVLWELARCPEATQRELADAVGVTPRTMTGLIDGLEATAFVARHAHATDRRATRVHLTSKGRNTTKWLLDSHAGLATELFGEMSARRYDCFAAGLSEVAERLKSAIDAAARDGGEHE